MPATRDVTRGGSLADQSPLKSDDARGRDLGQAQARVGTTALDRLDWAIRFARVAATAMTPGDWLNARLELSAFAGFLMREQDVRDPARFNQWRASPARSDQARIYSESEARQLQTEFARIVGELLQNNRATVGRYEMTLVVERWPLAPADPHRLARLRTSFPEDQSRATHVIGHLLGIYGHLVKACPAPLSRGKRGDVCGRWFLAGRPNQVYCSGRCQSRATTRAARERRPTRSPSVSSEDQRRARGPRARRVIRSRA